MSLTLVFKQFLQRHPHLKGVQWLLAVSGGIDSVALAQLCRHESIQFAVAHCNFNLRGAESLRDKQFVIRLAAHLDAPLYLKDFDTSQYVAETGQSVQVAARELRYQWFKEIISDSDCSFVATAHHADDNAETVLMHLFRGSGIKGLRGMLPIQGNIIRPLLSASRQQIESYALEQQLQWVEDSSNEGDKYTRNFLRHHVLPGIHQAIPQYHKGFEKSINLLTETEILYNEAIAQYRKKLVEEKGSEWHIPVLKLSKMPAAKTILYEIISTYGFLPSQLDDAFHLLEAASGKYVASPTHLLIRNRAWLIVAPIQTTEAAHILIEKHQTDIAFREGALQVQWKENESLNITADANIAMLDAANIHFPLLLRPWKQGDYFYPLGMPKKKKISRFLVDAKLSKTDKEKVWVIESRKKILWIVGQRIDDRFKIDTATRQVLQLQFNPILG